ncbi:MAG TPA: hypothetical protein VNQ99_06295 [Xanthobacteraceae bacterium]|nr:hypothetical protein [Xanthobacteraceae bacterium]
MTDLSAPASRVIVTDLTYSNGTAVAVRVNTGMDGMEVSDEGYGAFIADLMGFLEDYERAAVGTAVTWGIRFGERSFYTEPVREELLPLAVNCVANASMEAVLLIARSQP